MDAHCSSGKMTCIIGIFRASSRQSKVFGLDELGNVITVKFELDFNVAARFKWEAQVVKAFCCHAHMLRKRYDATCHLTRPHCAPMIKASRQLLKLLAQGVYRRPYFQHSRTLFDILSNVCEPPLYFCWATWNWCVQLRNRCATGQDLVKTSEQLRRQFQVWHPLRVRLWSLFSRAHKTHVRADYIMISRSSRRHPLHCFFTTHVLLSMPFQRRSLYPL